VLAETGTQPWSNSKGEIAMAEHKTVKDDYIRKVLGIQAFCSL